MKILTILTLTVLSLFLLAGCNTVKENTQAESSNQNTIGAPNQPNICTADYAPVCGVDDKTYSNDCMAGDVEIAYEGICEETHVCTKEEAENKACTREYNPVCDEDTNVTYATGCTACSEGAYSYVLGEC